MGLLARREHSRLELLQKMQIRGFDNQLIDTNIDNFIEHSWQSDRRYAEKLVRNRTLKQHGPLKIKMELKQKGVDEKIIEDCMDDGVYWHEIAKQALNKKFSSIAANQNEKNKYYRFLQQRGFSTEQIKLALQHHLS